MCKYSPPNSLVSENGQNGQRSPRFPRSLGPLELDEWEQLVALLWDNSMSDEPDSFQWKLEPSGQFSTSSLYKVLHLGASPFQAMDIWKARIPQKIKIFLWGCVRDVIRCSWAPASFAAFHSLNGRLTGLSRKISWLIFSPMSWALWQIRNKALIEGIFIKHPADALYKMIIFL